MSLHGRVSVIKMNILPRLNFLFSMLPLPPPPNMFKELDAICRNFLWKGKRPSISLSTLLRPKMLGGIALPNFKCYYWAFHLRSLKVWLDSSSGVPWRQIEHVLCYPTRIQDLPFCGAKIRSTRLHMGSIISNTLSIWYQIEKKLLHSVCKFHDMTPIWNNNCIQTGSVPFSFPQWANLGIHTLSDIFSQQGLRSFQDLKEAYTLPGSSWYLYRQLRTALKHMVYL